MKSGLVLHCGGECLTMQAGEKTMGEMSAERSINKELASLRAVMAEIQWTLKLHTWLLAINIALTVAVLFRLLSM